MNLPTPRVCVGIPVYNGENYLSESIESILRQTFTDFELIISDNGSTDMTEEICRKYAKQDERVRYYRSTENHGATWNHNRLVELARGEYFRWQAHDDISAPSFLERCVAALDTRPEVVLAYPMTRIVDEQGNVIRDFDMPLRTDSAQPHIRLHDLICVDHSCYQVYGLMRTAALRTTPAIGNFSGSDWNLLAELGLLGRFYEVREFLFLRREHQQVSTRAYKNNQELMAWFDPRKAGKISFPHWRRFYEFALSLRRVQLNPLERFRCMLVLAMWLWGRSYGGKRRWRFLAGDVKVAFRQAMLRIPPRQLILH
jgi:glycosyltransferase involved in cell wall biosynthesis